MNAYDSIQGKANVAAIESKLSEFDETFRQFCSLHEYIFSPTVDLFPRRRVWCRSEIDRSMDLTMDIGVQDVLDRGYYVELPWSLFANGSPAPGTTSDTYILSIPVFERAPFSRLPEVLAAGLERGLEILNGMNAQRILAEGKRHPRC